MTCQEMVFYNTVNSFGHFNCWTSGTDIIKDLGLKVCSDWFTKCTTSVVGMKTIFEPQKVSNFFSCFLTGCYILMCCHFCLSSTIEHFGSNQVYNLHWFFTSHRLSICAWHLLCSKHHPGSFLLANCESNQNIKCDDQGKRSALHTCGMQRPFLESLWLKSTLV